MDCKVLLISFAFLLAFSAAETFITEKSINIPNETAEKLRAAVQRSDIETLATDLNGYVDEIFVLIDKFLLTAGLDPTELEDIHKSFEYKPLLVTYHGELDLINGWLQDLSTLHRVGDVALTLQGNGDIVLTVPLGFDDLVFSYDYSAKIMNLGPTGAVDGKVVDVETEIKAYVDLATQKLTLQSFKITSAGKISLKFSGNGLVDWMVNIFTKLVTTVLHDLVIKIVQNVITSNVDEIIDLVNSILGN